MLRGERGVVHGCLRMRYGATHEALIQVLAEERHDRREEARQRGERFIERLIRGERVAARARLPEARAVAPPVPRGEVRPEGLHLEQRGANVVSAIGGAAPRTEVP